MRSSVVKDILFEIWWLSIENQGCNRHWLASGRTFSGTNIFL